MTTSHLADSLRAMHERVKFDEKRHAYAVDGEAMDPVTKIIGETLAKGQGFLGWIAKLSREGQDWRKVGREEGDKGKQVHRMAENWARKRLGLEPLPVELGAEAAYLFAGLESWLDKSGLEPIFQPEIRVFHGGLRYAGTLDLCASLGNSQLVVDFKTTKTADDFWDEWSLQNAAYRCALSVTCGDWAGAIVRIPKDGSGPNMLMLGDAEEDFMAFSALLRVYRWKHKREGK